jgi:hypothetical protein
MEEEVVVDEKCRRRKEENLKVYPVPYTQMIHFDEEKNANEMTHT